MAIDAATVRKVAHLARIKTPEDRLEPLAQELNGIPVSYTHLTLPTICSV